MKTSENGIKIIKKFEGCKLEAYRCPSGILTIGYGHTQNVNAGETITRRQALYFLEKDIEVAEKAVNSLVKVTLNQNQYDALVSFVFNVGYGNFRISTMLKLINQDNLSAAAEQFDKWVLSNGRKIRGLVIRRRLEKELFLREE